MKYFFYFIISINKVYSILFLIIFFLSCKSNDIKQSPKRSEVLNHNQNQKQLENKNEINLKNSKINNNREITKYQITDDKLLKSDNEDLVRNNEENNVILLRNKRYKILNKNICNDKDIINKTAIYRSHSIICEKEKIKNKIIYDTSGQNKSIVFTYWKNGNYKSIEYFNEDGKTIKSKYCFSEEINRKQTECDE